MDGQCWLSQNVVYELLHLCNEATHEPSQVFFFPSYFLKPEMQTYQLGFPKFVLYLNNTKVDK